MLVFFCLGLCLSYNIEENQVKLFRDISQEEIYYNNGLLQRNKLLLTTLFSGIHIFNWKTTQLLKIIQPKDESKLNNNLNLLLFREYLITESIMKDTIQFYNLFENTLEFSHTLNEQATKIHWMSHSKNFIFFLEKRNDSFIIRLIEVI